MGLILLWAANVEDARTDLGALLENRLAPKSGRDTKSHQKRIWESFWRTDNPPKQAGEPPQIPKEPPRDQLQANVSREKTHVAPRTILREPVRAPADLRILVPARQAGAR